MCQINKMHFDVWCVRWLIDLSVLDLTFLFSHLPGIIFPWLTHADRVTPFLHLSCLWLRAHCPAPTASQHELSLLSPGRGRRGVAGVRCHGRPRWSLYSWNVWIIAGCVSPFSHITCDRLIVAKLSSNTHDLSVCQEQIDKIKASLGSLEIEHSIQLHNTTRLAVDTRYGQALTCRDCGYVIPKWSQLGPGLWTPPS